jgi:transmembrane sensor
MDEHRIIELLTRKIANEASAEELGELSYLLAKYPDSVYYEALLEQVWGMGERNTETDLEEVYKQHKLKFKTDLDFESSGLRLKKIMKKPAAWMTALACLVIAFGTFVFNYSKPAAMAETIHIKAGMGVRKEIRLPDGTFVRLNSGSGISYKSDMLSSDIRDVYITGEAFFNVTHDTKHPFIVRTHRVAIRVLGTEFNVKEYPGEGESETTLIKGSIELTINNRTDQKFLLKPSEKFALVEKDHSQQGEDIGSSVLTIENISPVKLGDKEYIREVSWVENNLVFQNETFEQLIPKLERWYNVKITLEDPKIRSYRYTGIFIDENIIQALEAMQLIKPFNYKHTENEVKIY